MFRNYCKVAWRNLVNNKVFSLINILGLALGMACSLVIGLWVKDELSYDSFQKNGNRLYKVMVHHKKKNGDITGSMESTEGLLGDALKKEIPEVEGASMVFWESELLFDVGEKSGKEKGSYASPDFFTMFSFPMLRGNPATVLTTPDQIVISRKLAENYFGKEDPVGKTIRIGNKKDYRVSGEYENMPENSSIQYDFLLPLKVGFAENAWMVRGWGNYGPPTYVMLRPDADPKKVNAKIRDFIFQHDAKEYDKILSLQPYRDVRLYSRFTKGVATGGRIEYIRLFSLVAIFILVIACINFMNLATARSAKRAREVGIRKAVGAEKGVLFRQFMGEAFLTTILSVGLALILTSFSLPLFNELTGKRLVLPLTDPSLMLGLLLLTLLTAFIAGSYPALFLSALNPVKVLKGIFKFNPGALLMRKGLVVFQFALSILLIISTLIIYRQMQYVQTKNLGLDRNNLVYIPLEGALEKKADIFKSETLRSGKTDDITIASSIPNNVGMASDSVSWPGKDPNDKTGLWEMAVNYDFIRTMKIELIAGRDYSRSYGADSSNYLINEEAAKIMHLKNPVVGQTMTFMGHKGIIIGLMKDFHIHSLHDPMAPLLVHFQADFSGQLAIVRIKPGKMKGALADMQATCKRLNPEYPFTCWIGDEVLSWQYSSEMLTGKLATVSAVLAIFISCLGLFGLSLFMAEQRTKEVGIRKVLGAKIINILIMLSRDFVLLILLSALIAFPLAWLTMNNWLQTFQFRIGISVWYLVLAGGGALLIAIITISFEAIRVAVSNPVKSLRSE